jgi:hypothetical protein
MPLRNFVFFAAALISFHVTASGQTPPKPSFVARTDYAVGSSPQGIAVGDLNSDGNLDLVTLGYNGSVSVLLGNADGTFQPAVEYSVPVNSIIVQLGDFNGDGNLDIFVATQSTTAVAIASVSVLLGNGDGTFQAQKVTDIASNSNCRCLVAGDFNGDGKWDVAIPVTVPQQGDSAMTVILGNGDGTFQAPITANPGPFPTPLVLKTADFNSDGILDLVTGSEVFLGDGDGTFRQPNMTGGNGEFVVADFTGDGKLDIACPCGPSYQIAVLPGNGDGTFQPAILTDAALSSPVSLSSGDLNGDGKPDLVIIGTTVLLGNGDGTFQVPGFTTNLPGTSAVLGDFNKDGKVDIATYSGGSTSSLGIVSVALGSGNGTFQVDTQVAGGGDALSVLADDFTSDGKTDLLEVLGSLNAGQSLILLPGNGNGTFQSTTTNGIVEACGTVFNGNPPCAAAAGDFNGDGKLDVAVTGTGASGSVGVFLGNGDGTFKSEVDYGGAGSSIALGDFNGDGKIDIVTSGTTANNVSLLLGNGDGTFGFPTAVPINGPANFVVAGDFNKDGHLDLAVATGSAVAILLGNGNGTFQSEIDIPTPAGATTLAVADLNNDGNLDIVAGSSSSNIISVLLGNGSGTSFTVTTYPVLGDVFSLAVGDFNRDGKADLAVANATDVSILVGNGNGTFQSAVNFGADGTSLAIADFNRDGSLDIAAGNSLLFNRLGGAAASLAPGLAAFGNTSVGSTSVPQLVTLSNTGKVALSIIGIMITGPQSSEYAETNTCGTSVAVGAKCTIRITFTPAASGSRSATLTVTDDAGDSPQTAVLTGTGVPSLKLVASNGSAKVAAGQPANYSLSIGGGGLSGTASLTCTGAPKGAECSLPARENVDAVTASKFTVTVNTAARMTAGMTPNSSTLKVWLWGLAIFGMVILPGSARRTRTRGCLSRILPILLLLGLSGCGGSGGSSGGQSGTPAGTYTLTVTAKSASATQSVPLTLTVQ